jgi:hypothetical protein
MFYFDLKTPCNECPFLKEQSIVIERNRAKQIIDEISDNKTFPCHKTNGMKIEQQCAGALLYLESNHIPNQMLRMADRLGIYKPNELKGYELVFTNAKEMLKSFPKKFNAVNSRR